MTSQLIYDIPPSIRGRIHKQIQNKTETKTKTKPNQTMHGKKKQSTGTRTKGLLKVLSLVLVRTTQWLSSDDMGIGVKQSQKRKFV